MTKQKRKNWGHACSAVKSHSGTAAGFAPAPEFMPKVGRLNMPKFVEMSASLKCI